jgi:hypothetical protein
MSYVIAGYLATVVIIGGYIAWVVIESRRVAARLLSVEESDAGNASGGAHGGSR